MTPVRRDVSRGTGMGGSMPLMPVCLDSKKKGEASPPLPFVQNSSDMPPGTVWTTRSMTPIGRAS